MTFDLNPAQWEAAVTLDRDVVVTAGAGSGKTRMLTQRFINAVVPGCVTGWEPAAVDDIVAITFTDKAAGELAERVRQALRDAGRVDEARRVDGAWVSTIHGLCSRLLRRHALEAGIDPLFDVADTVVAGNLRAEAFERAAVELLDSDPDVAALLDAYSYSRVFKAVLDISRKLAVLGLESEDVEAEPTDDTRLLLARAIELFAFGRTACDDYSGTAKAPAEYSARCGDLLGEGIALEGSGAVEGDVLAALGRLVSAYRPLRAIKGLEDVGEESRILHVALKGGVGAALVAPYARGLRELVGRFSARFGELKRSAGVLDFDDLQVHAVRLLTDHPGLAERYRGRFRLVMIDEFQDTDALQLRLVEALSRNDLCTVGDENQSIYRFRGADIAVYRSHRARMSERAALKVSLGVNYRSHPDVLAFVNAVFASQEYFGDDLLRLTPPEDGRPAQEIDSALGDGPRVEALFVDSSAGDARHGRRAEAVQIARRLAGLRDDGVHPGDMAILVRRYSNAHVFTEALAAEGLPAIIVGGSRFFELEEVAIMRALVRAIANPEDGSAVGELLASEFCPVSDDGLARLRLTPDGRDDRSLWTVLCESGASTQGEDGETIRRLIGVIERARHDVGSRPLGDVLLQVVETAGYDLRLLSHGNPGRDAFANVLKFARQAAAFEAAGGTGPAGFSAYMDSKERLGDVETPAAVADDGSQVVRIMSVHAAKGLEFPVVVVPDLASGGPAGSDIARTAACGQRLHLAMMPPATDDEGKPPESAWATELGDSERDASAEESQRVLYVAFTRARDLLIASGATNLRPKNASTAKHDLMKLARILGVAVPIDGTRDVETPLVDAATGHEVACRVRIVDGAETLAALAPSPDAEAPRTCTRAAVAPGRLSPTSSSLRVPERVSYSSLHLFEQCARRFWLSEVLRLSRVEILEPGASDPMRFGTAMHAVLQLVDRRGVLPSDERIAALGRQFELDAAQRRRLRLGVERFAGSRTAERVVVHERVAREMPFMLQISDGKRTLVGNIDVYARTGREALIVDYKSGGSGEPADELSARYRLQAVCYALAAVVDGCEHVDVVFVRPEVLEADGGPQEISFAFKASDEPALLGEVESRCADIGASRFDALAARDERICGDCPAPGGLCPNARP